jgi:hypothetical protein
MAVRRSSVVRCVYWREIAALSEDKAMSDNVTTALQVNATTGNGETVVLHERRLVTFKIQGNGPTSAGQVTIECCPQPSPIASGSGSGGAMVWTTGLKIESDTHEADNFLRTLGGQDAEIAMISATEWQRSGASHRGATDAYPFAPVNITLSLPCGEQKSTIPRKLLEYHRRHSRRSD